MLLFTVYLPIEHIINFLVYEVHKQHHTLTQILMGLLRTEFVLDAVENAEPPADMMNTPSTVSYTHLTLPTIA
mgnify:CR=1 FL=1